MTVVKFQPRTVFVQSKLLIDPRDAAANRLEICMEKLRAGALSCQEARLSLVEIDALLCIASSSETAN